MNGGYTTKTSIRVVIKNTKEEEEEEEEEEEKGEEKEGRQKQS